MFYKLIKVYHQITKQKHFIYLTLYEFPLIEQFETSNQIT